MYVLNLQGASPSVARVTDPGWTVINTDVPPDCACKGTNNCGQGLWHYGAGNPVSNPYSESGYSGPKYLNPSLPRTGALASLRAVMAPGSHPTPVKLMLGSFITHLLTNSLPGAGLLPPIQQVLCIATGLWI